MYVLACSYMRAYLTVSMCVFAFPSTLMDHSFIMFNSLVWFRLPDQNSMICIRIYWFESLWYHSKEMNEILYSIQTTNNVSTRVEKIYWTNLCTWKMRHTKSILFSSNFIKRSVEIANWSITQNRHYVFVVIEYEFKAKTNVKQLLQILIRNSNEI